MNIKLGINKQPFYCRATVLFTGIRDMDRETFLSIMRGALRGHAVLSSVEIEEWDDPEPGDPADLL